MRTVAMVVSSIVCASSSSAQPLTYEQQLQASRRVFAAIDSNHNGVISREEWLALAGRMAAQIPKPKRNQYIRTLDAKFRSMDKNGDGKVTFEEDISDNFGKDRR